MNRRLFKNQQDGSFLVMAMAMILLITALGVSLSQVTTVQYQHAKRAVFEQNAILLAEAGIEQTVHALNNDDEFAGYATPQEFFNNNPQGLGTFTTEVTDSLTDNSKTILATGKVYRNATDSQPLLTRKVKVVVVGTSSEGYSMFSGPGGLILDGLATIVNSSVYTSGSITMNGTAQIGTLLTPLQVDVANNQCPTGSSPGPTYPEVCSDGTQPIAMNGALNHIYGDICATGQTSNLGGRISGGLTGGSGLQTGCVAPVTPLPTYDRQAQIDAVTTTADSSDTGYDCKGQASNISWPANLQLNGNVNLKSICNVTVNGDVYITGNLDIGGITSFKVADSVGVDRPHIIVDGTISVGGVGTMQANSSGTGIEFISFKSNAACNPACTELSGNELKESQNLETVSVKGITSMPGMIFNAYWGKIKVSSVNIVGAVIGQTVELNGIATITFGTELSSGQSTWTIRSYQQVYE